MDTIQLMKAIEEKRKLAQIQAEEIIAKLQEYSLFDVSNISYRIKGKESILEKIKFLKSTPDGANMTEEQILDEILDIIGITVEVKNFTNAMTALEQIEDIIHNEWNETRENILISGDKDMIEELQQYNNEGLIELKISKTGYKGVMLHYNSKGKVAYEIQITDKENIRIREETHEEFKKIKYQEVRNSITNTKENKSDDREI